MVSYGKSKSRVQETKLSTAQAQLLQSREADFRRYFLPHILTELRKTAREAGSVRPEMLTGALGDVNRAFQVGKRQVTQNLAQRGITNPLLAASVYGGLAGTRASAVSGLAQQSRTGSRTQLLQMFQQGNILAPKTTTAAPIGQKMQQSRWGVIAG